MWGWNPRVLPSVPRSPEATQHYGPSRSDRACPVVSCWSLGCTCSGSLFVWAGEVGSGPEVGAASGVGNGVERMRELELGKKTRGRRESLE